MGRTFVNQERQIAQSDSYDDTIVPSLANFETNPANLEQDMNNLRSIISELRDNQAGNWYDALSASTGFENGAARGVQDVNQDLHNLERKRVLVKAISLVDVTVANAENWVVLGTGEFPPNLIAAVGAVTTRGTVVATHGATFDTHSLAEVAGVTAISPKNFVNVVDGATRDPLLSSGRTIYGLLHGESGLADGDTIINTTPDRVQVSFVRINATGDDLEACPVSDIQDAVVNLCFQERKALEDLNEADFLRGAVVDVPAASTVTRQVSYDNQGTTPVDQTTNATLDLEGAGLAWSIRDDGENAIFTVTEGNAGGTGQVEIGSDADTFSVLSATNSFDNGASFDDSAAGTTINIGVTANQIDSGGALTVQSASSTNLNLFGQGEILLNDGNFVSEATWAQAGVKVTETTAEITAYETAFGGEVSLFNAIVQANASTTQRTKGVAVATANVTANVDVSGPSGTSDLDVDLPDFSGATFTTDVDVFLNGVLLRGGANAAANHDVYPGTDPSIGELKFEFDIKGTGGKPDQITMIVWS